MIIMTLALCFASFACGDGGSSSGATKSSSSGETKKAEHFKPAKFRDAVFKSDNAQGNGEVQIDLSSSSKGYMALKCDSDARIKLQVFKGDETYTYDVVQRKKQVFPFQCGDGSYTIKVMKNISDSNYFELYTCYADVHLKNSKAPYLRPNQYANYKKDSQCVQEASNLAASAANEQEFVNSIYKYITSKIKYDYDKAATVESGYIPDPDETLETGKGICIDYACLAASMLRSQGIPTKIIFGYVEPDDLYHAWNMFYTKKEGWTTVEFKVNPKKWNRIDLTFAANGADGEFIGDGSNYADVYQY